MLGILLNYSRCLFCSSQCIINVAHVLDYECTEKKIPKVIKVVSYIINRRGGGGGGTILCVQ